MFESEAILISALEADYLGKFCLFLSGETNLKVTFGLKAFFDYLESLLFRDSDLFGAFNYLLL